MGQLWFLVALLPIIPLFIIFASKIKPLVMIIIVVVVSIHYHFFYQNYSSSFPLFYYRAFAGLCGGVLVYHLGDFFAKQIKSRGNIQRMIFLGGNAVLLLTLGLGYKSSLDFKVVVICFVLGFYVLLGSGTDVKYKPAECTAFLGRRFSFPMYVVHLPIADLVAFYSKNRYHFSAPTQYCLYFLICILAVVALTFIADSNKKLVNKYLLS